MEEVHVQRATPLRLRTREHWRLRCPRTAHSPPFFARSRHSSVRPMLGRSSGTVAIFTRFRVLSGAHAFEENGRAAHDDAHVSGRVGVARASLGEQLAGALAEVGGDHHHRRHRSGEERWYIARNEPLADNDRHVDATPIRARDPQGGLCPLLGGPARRRTPSRACRSTVPPRTPFRIPWNGDPHGTMRMVCSANLPVPQAAERRVSYSNPGLLERLRVGVHELSGGGHGACPRGAHRHACSARPEVEAALPRDATAGRAKDRPPQAYTSCRKTGA